MFPSYVFAVWLTFCQLLFCTLTEAANYGNIKIFILPFFGVIAYVLSAVVVSKSPSYVSAVWLTFCKLWFLTFTETASCCGNVKIFILRFRRMAYVFLGVEVSKFFILRFWRMAYVLSVTVLGVSPNLSAMVMLKISSYVFAVWLTFFYVWKCQTFSSYVFDVWLTFCQL